MVNGGLRIETDPSLSPFIAYYTTYFIVGHFHPFIREKVQLHWCWWDCSNLIPLYRYLYGMGQFIWFFLASNIGVKEICLPSRTWGLSTTYININYSNNVPDIKIRIYSMSGHYVIQNQMSWSYVGNQNATSICLWCTFFYAPKFLQLVWLVWDTLLLLIKFVSTLKMASQTSWCWLLGWIHIYIYFFSFSWRIFLSSFQIKGAKNFFYKSSSGLGLAVLKL